MIRAYQLKDLDSEPCKINIIHPCPVCGRADNKVRKLISYKEKVKRYYCWHCEIEYDEHGRMWCYMENGKRKELKHRKLRLSTGEVKEIIAQDEGYDAGFIKFIHYSTGKEIRFNIQHVVSVEEV